MTSKEVIKIFKERPELQRRGLCFLVSVIFHVTFILLLIKFVSPMKVYIYEDLIADVIIVPPEKIFIPEIEKYPKSIDDFNIIPPEKALKKSYRSSDRTERFESEGVGENIQSDSHERAFTQDLSLSLRLNSHLKGKSELPLDSRLNFYLIPEKTKNKIDEIYKSYKREDLNFLNYIYPEYSKVRSGKTGLSSGGPGPRAARQKGSVYFRSKSYDISPWAKEIVNRIQKNWFIPPGRKIGMKGMVGISVTVEKNGQFSSAQFVHSSNVQLLDQAAMKALTASSPFPKLPDDFPDKNLKVYFEFRYND